MAFIALFSNGCKWKSISSFGALGFGTVPTMWYFFPFYPVHIVLSHPMFVDMGKQTVTRLN
jgi:hypothetical protein